MSALTREKLYSLEEYAEKRPQIRKDVIATKKIRNVHLGDHVLFMFENVETIQYQIQEMLRIEKIFESEGIQEELDVYNPLIPDGSNWKATFMIEYTNVIERKKALAKLIGIEQTIWVRVDDSEKVFAISNEDLTRDNNEKTASVHFMRFELTKNMHAQAKVGLPIYYGIDHPLFKTEVVVPPEIHKSLVQDLD